MSQEKKKRLGRPPVRPVTKPALSRAIEFAGGVRKLSASIGVNERKITEWLYSEKINIPAHHVPKIVEATRGKVKPEELRPDVYIINIKA